MREFIAGPGIPSWTVDTIQEKLVADFTACAVLIDDGAERHVA